MPSIRGLRLVLISILAVVGVVAGISSASGAATDDAVERAALAPYSDFLHKDADGLCSDFTPAVAAKLVAKASAGQGCEEVAAQAFADGEVLVLGPEPTVIGATVYARLGRAWVKLRLDGGSTQVAALRRVAGRWRVSSAAFLALSTCPPVASLQCHVGSKILTLATFESAEIAYIPTGVRRAGGRVLREYEAGSNVTAQSGCLACHRIGDSGNQGPGPNLTNIGSVLSRVQVARALVNPKPPMPSFKNLPAKKFTAIIHFISQLRHL
ncbi:MAG: c-type cytochrome [Solirubrobacteraceae bacterium]